MPAVERALVVGAGIAGLAAAIGLARRGVQVELLERGEDVSPVGSGITLQGNALRCLEALGVGDLVRDGSWSFNVLSFRDPADGHVIATLDADRAGGPDFPATAGMYRPTLARILFDRARELGVSFRWNAHVEEVWQDPDSAWLRTSLGETMEGQLVVAADGLNSTVRGLLGIDDRPEVLGMGVWRAFVPRPPGITHTELTYGGPAHYVGYCPTSSETMYAYVVEDLTDRSGMPIADQVRTMRELAQAYPEPWKEIADTLDERAQVNYTAITRLLVRPPWNRGRVLLIGDAVHSCPPTLAQGAAQALEDAAVLEDLIARHDRLDHETWDQFHARRVPRATRVVEGSVTLSQWQRERRPGADAAALMREIVAMLAVPA
jgi:2-polyprenyl-6-methoxyphenol hydroxylase-like FAD-dependent oxidoreductase